MPSRAITSAWISAFIILLCTTGYGQDRAALEAQRKALLQQIETNTKLLSRAQKEQTVTLDEIERLNAEIGLRRKVVRNYQAEIALLSTSLDQKTARLQQLKEQATDLANEHAHQMREAYFERKLDIRILYLLSARNLNEAFERWRFYQAVSRMRQESYNALIAHSDSITAEVQAIQKLRADKQKVAENTLIQEKALASTRQESERVLNQLKSKEKDIRAKLEKQKRESERLAAEIERIIRVEVDKSTGGAADLPMAPELKLLTDKFESNKGKLPWPVDRGIITGYFGEQPHPVVPSIKIVNNGIDITATPGSTVNAIFGGKVVGIKTIPGYDYTVIIQHGAYYSVYSRLADVSVEIGDNVRTAQRIGRLAAASGQNPKLHLEIWQSKVQVDPELWISHN